MAVASDRRRCLLDQAVKAEAASAGLGDGRIVMTNPGRVTDESSHPVGISKASYEPSETPDVLNGSSQQSNQGPLRCAGPQDGIRCVRISVEDSWQLFAFCFPTELAVPYFVSLGAMNRNARST